MVIPDSILDGAGAIEDYFAYAFIYPSDDNSGQTEHRIEIGVKSRPKPEGYKGSGDDTMGAIMKAVNEIAAGKADGLEYKNSILRLMSGDMELARVTISGGSGTGSDAREIELQKSETAIQWRYVGEEYWKDLVDLADLKGDRGPAGKDGVDGAPGKDGADGITPHIGENGNWYLGEADTGVKASGSDGVTPHIGDNGNWYIGEIDTGLNAEAPSIDSTLTESGKAADAKITGEKISALKNEIDQLEQAGTGSGSGVNVAQSNSLWAIIQKAAFAEALTDKELNDFKTAWGITTENIPATGITLDKSTLSFTDSATQTLIATIEPSNSTDKVTWESSDAGIATVSGGVVTPISNGSCTITAKAGSYSAACAVTVDIAEEEQVTLTSISATYTGGDVAVGTALTDLIGITVTGIYSDGSTSAITGYTLSGTIAEGSNTITVSYGGKTTTFTVTGVVESGGGEVTAELPIDGLMGYFDFRTCEYNNEASGGSASIQPTQGNGQLYAWQKNAVIEQNEYGVRLQRPFMYDADGGASQSECGDSFTWVFKCYLTTLSSPMFTNDYASGSTTSKINYKPKYNTASSTAQVAQEGLGTRLVDAYELLILVVNNNICKLYFENKLIKEIDGSSIDGFVSWYSKLTIAILGSMGSGYFTQLAIYNKALSEVEITEMQAYLKTLEVA